MKLMFYRTRRKSTWDRSLLEQMDDDSLFILRSQLETKVARIEREKNREQVFRSLIRNRSRRLLLDSFSTFRLSQRLERLFVALREGTTEPWPIHEVLSVFDGLVARMLGKRITLILVGLVTVLPAVSSLLLLAQQNHIMFEQNRVEGSYSLETIRKALLEVIYSTYQQTIVENGETQILALPSYHRRIREEAFGTFISIDKQRWSRAEKEAIPPVRYVDLRGCELSNVSLGGTLGLIEGESRDDLTRIFLADSNLVGTSFLRSKLTGSVFRGAQAEGLVLSCSDATYCDFSRIQARQSHFGFDARNSIPLDLSHSNFQNANLEGSYFDQATVINCNFEGAKLDGVTMAQGILADCDLTTADFGAGIRLPETTVVRTLIRKDQLPLIEFPSFCFVETTDDPDILRIMTDKAAYETWWAQTQAEMDAAVQAEQEQVEQHQQALKAAGEI